MGSVGDGYDNAMAESFFATLECELLDRTRFTTQHEALRAELDDTYRRRVAPATTRSYEASPCRISSKNRT